MIVKMVREGVVVGRGGGGNDAVVWYNHLYLVPKPATLEGRIKKKGKAFKTTRRKRRALIQSDGEWVRMNGLMDGWMDGRI